MVMVVVRESEGFERGRERERFVREKRDEDERKSTGGEVKLQKCL